MDIQDKILIKLLKERITDKMFDLLQTIKENPNKKAVDLSRIMKYDKQVMMSYWLKNLKELELVEVGEGKIYRVSILGNLILNNRIIEEVQQEQKSNTPLEPPKAE